MPSQGIPTGGLADRRAGAGSTPVAWSPAQRVRLESEWRTLRRSFAFHPVVRVIPLAGDPPAEFEIQYRLRTLVVDPGGQLAYVESCAVNISLPPQFPHAAPLIRPLSSLFHPNVSADAVLVTPPWNPATGSLADLVSRCGQLLALQIYDPSAVLNRSAMDWVAHYPQLIPTDANAVLTPDAGGDPLTRIVRCGTQTLEQYRAQLTERSLTILESGPGTGKLEVRQFGEQMSRALGIFLDNDIPEHLRSLAVELDAWARSMTETRSIWDDLRSLYANTRAATAAAQQVNQAQDAIESTLAAVNDLVKTEPAKDPLETIARLPAVTLLDPLAIRLRSNVRDAEQRDAALRTAVEGLSVPSLSPIGTPGGLLFERTTADVTRGMTDADAARETGSALLAAIEQLLERAVLEQTALDSLVAWAGFTDLMRRGNELAQRLIASGAAGIQAYFIHGPSGTFGPHEFEERIDLGTVLLVVRRIAAGPLEIFDARSMALLGKGPGSVRVKIPDAQGNPCETEIRATEHADELRLQLQYLLKTSGEQVASLGKPGGAKAASWAGRFSAALAQPNAVHAATEVHRRATHRWMALLADLDELAQLKERLATHHLLERHVEFVPAVLAARDKAEASLAEANERLGFIAARSGHDPETDELIVPPQFAQENIERLKQREKAEKDLAKVRKLLSLVAAEVQARLANKRPLGKPGLPKLRLLRMEAEAHAGLAEVLTNEHLHARVAEIERLLGTRLRAAQ